MNYIAHKRENPNSEQSVKDHLEQTARLAACFAEAFLAQTQAQLCGLLHDIGKYSEKFQRRIVGENISVDHSTAGTQLCASRYRNAPAAFCIAGHHGGLPDMGGKFDTAENGTMRGKLEAEVEDYSAYNSELELPAEFPHHELEKTAENAYFYTKMLYSCLVDADFLDTERFMSGEIDRCMQTV